jgi:hypothetical protein
LQQIAAMAQDFSKRKGPKEAKRVMTEVLGITKMPDLTPDKFDLAVAQFTAA